SDPVVIVPDVELPEGTGELNLDQLAEAEAEAGAVPVSVPRAESVVVPESVVPVPPNVADPHLSFALAVAEGSPVGQWADYILARTVHDRRAGVPLVLAEILKSLRIEQRSIQSRFVVGVLEATGVLAPHSMRKGATYDQMRRAVGLVAGKLAADESISLWQVAGTVLGAKSQSAGAWRVLGWVTGAMLLHPVRGGARQRMKDGVVELGRQARLHGQVPDVEGFARSVFGVEATTELSEHQKFLVSGWLSGEEVSWGPVAGQEVTPGPVVPGPEVTPGLDRFADDVVTTARSQLALGGLVDISGMEGVVRLGEWEMFGIGVLEWMGLASIGGRMRSGATFREMQRVVASARRDKAEGRSVDARRYETTKVVGSGEWARRVARINGWLTAAGVVGSRPVNGSRQALIDKARGLAAATGVTGNGGYDLLAIARQVFEVEKPADHQMYVVGTWVGVERQPEASPVVEERRTTTGPGPAVAVITQLLGGLPSPALGLDENVSLRERAEYAVQQAVLRRARGDSKSVNVLTREAFAGSASNVNRGMVSGFLEGIGLDSLLRLRSTTTDRHMAGVFAAARRSLAEGKPVDPLAIVTSILGHRVRKEDQYFSGKVTGWLVVAGLMGGPVVKDGVIERIKGALT
ncbi:hypothetical protein ACFUMI_38930, partial [Streptomyces sp. NPDC057273]|uniref:hypothetical protein n=1 Tax=Streptomyces sp. NPDC057273 TaxID=3346080 RepID=UPI003632040C